MLKNSHTEIPYSEIDWEVRELCRAINAIDGIETTESCYGHGERPCNIWLEVDSISAFNRFLYYCFNHEWKWQIQINMNDPILDSEKLDVMLTTNDICDEYFVQLMLENLTYRINRMLDIISAESEEKDANSN